MGKYIPNILSCSRIVLSLVLLILYSVDSTVRFNLSIALLLIILATDFLDGHIARKLGVSSEVGYILDGLGDRAVYLSLILIFYYSHAVNIIVVWLAIFYEIAIYAVRLMVNDWHEYNKKVRRISLLHAFGVRVWLLFFLVADGVKVHSEVDIFNVGIIPHVCFATIIATLLVSYYGFYKIFTTYKEKNSITEIRGF